MTKPRTHVLFIIDASGSMAPYRDDTIGAFDGFLNTLTADSGIDYLITVALFSSREFYKLHAHELAPNDPKLRLDADSYQTRGLTALLDATGHTLTTFIDTHNKLGDHETVQVVSITDGAENNSINWTHESVASLINALRRGGKFQFTYLAQGFDGWRQASRSGYRADDYVGTRSIDTESTTGLYNTAGEVIKTRSRGMRTNTSEVAARHLAADNLRTPEQ